MKTNYDICHEFAQGYKTNGRGGNIFYETETNGNRFLYSYGYHFAIARITPAGQCFFTTSTYSVTTAKHISNARGALSHYDLIFCPDPSSAWECWEAWRNQLQTQEKNLIKAIKRTKADRAAAILATLKQIETYCTATGEALPDYFGKYKAVAESQQPSAEGVQMVREERERERERKRAAELRARLEAERVRAWERGETNWLSWRDTENNVPLRLEACKGYEIVNTGKGVKITIEAARRFYKALKAGEIQRGQSIDTGAETYTVREVTAEVVRVGCHTWQIAYLDNFYKQIENK